MIRLLLASILAAGAASAQTASLSSFEAFQKAATVIRHPRCLNCHIPGDQPLIGSNGEVHPMLVKRGADGKGTSVLRCSTCHQETNGELPHSPPGTKGWQLPGPKNRLAWAGLDDQKLCRGILNVLKNGGQPRDKIADYVNSDPRVLWAWDPGPGREKPSMDRLEFVELIRTWVEKGASCAP